MPQHHLARRTLVLAGLGLPICVTTLRAQAPATAQVRLRIDSDALLYGVPREARRELQEQKDESAEAQQMILQAPPQRRVVPVILIAVGVLAIPVIWNSIQEMYRQYYYGGVLLDLRQSPPLITYSKAIPANMTFVTDTAGKTTEYKADEFTQDLLEKLLLRAK